MNESKCCFDDALEVVMKTNENLVEIQDDLLKSAEWWKCWKWDKIKTLTTTKYLLFPSLITAILKDGKASAEVCQLLLNVCYTGCNTTSSVLGTAGKFAKAGEDLAKFTKPFVVANAVLQVVEVVSFVVKLTGDHVTCEIIKDAVEKLEKLQKKFRLIAEELKQACEEGLKRDNVFVFGAQVQQ